MTSTRFRHLAVVAGLAGLTLAGLPAPSATATDAHRPAVGDRCLIGTWHDNANLTSTRWNGTHVVMRAGGGDVEHVFASGVDRDNWQKSKPLVGTVKGHRLVEKVRGLNTMVWRASGRVGSRKPAKLTQIELGWSASSTNRYVYRGKHSNGYLNQKGRYPFRYTCTSTTLTFYGKKGRSKGTETRISRKP